MYPKINKNNSKNLISIIIPFFNAEKFIQEAIESVLAQTYSNWELLLIKRQTVALKVLRVWSPSPTPNILLLMIG